MKYPLFSRLPSFEEYSNDLVLDRFLDYVAEKKLTLYSAQEEAILALIDGQNVILNTPTGSGKSLVATAMHFHSLAQGKRSVYTCPVKALVNEKFLALCREFGPEQVGLATGDGSVNRDAPILCCTAEILANMALREGEFAKVDDVVMDEFHYYSDRERGVAWQIPLLSMPQTRFLLMSATLGEMDFFQEKLTLLNDRPTAVVSGAERPVPLNYEYRETPLHETVKDLINASAAPVYLVNFTQREAAEQAQNLMSVDFTSKELKKEITERLRGVGFQSPYGKEIQKFLKHGVGLHHAGLLPKYRILVERLAQDGLLKVISGTDTLGVGVNIPIRTVLFTQLCKYDGEKTALLKVRDFHQIAGRAGRKGFDESGRVAAQAPSHVIENKRMEEKAKGDAKKTKKLVKAKPPERGFVPWGPETFSKLVTGQPEALQSRFEVSHGLLLNVLSRDQGDGCKAMRELIRSSHESPADKKKHRARAWTLFRALLDRKLIEFAPVGDRKAGKIRVNVSLQDDFSLNQSLSLWLIDTLKQLDPGSETYALDLLTLVEAILESPDAVLRKQLDRVKTEKMREMKEAGVEYDERIEELEKLEHPKPLRDFIYSTFNVFSEAHPWVGTENIRPKSIAREMFETYQSFTDYIREYDLHRSEGVLLRYLSDVYKALMQTVPNDVKNDEFAAIVEYFGTVVRSVDSSLVDEWERLKNGASAIIAKESVTAEPVVKPANLFTDERSIKVKIVSEIFRFIRALSVGDFDEALGLIAQWSETNTPWDLARLERLAKAYSESGHKRLLTDPAARKAHHTKITKNQQEWIVEQRLVDPEEHNDWELRVRIPIEASVVAGCPILELQKIGEVGLET